MFNLATAIAERDKGIARVQANADPSFLTEIRAAAKRIVDACGSVTSDDLREYAEKNGLKPHHPNVWGTIFKGKHWFTAGRKQSAKVTNHARWIHVWQYRA